MSKPPLHLQGHQADARLAFGDALRGIAALWVVLFHMREGGHIDALLALLPPVLEAVLFSSGHLGVAVFFVLSGYVMGLSVKPQGLGWPEAGRFMARRLVRLAPPYYFALGVSVALLYVKAYATQTAWPEITAMQWFSHLTFTTEIFDQPLLNVVYWTLCLEVQFYLAFALTLRVSESVAKRRPSIKDPRGLVLCVVAVLSMAWPLGLAADPGWLGSFAGFWYTFTAGVLVAQARLGSSAVQGFAAACILAMLWVGYVRQDVFTLTSAATAILLWWAQSPWAPRPWGSGWRGWAFLGMVSYSLYLLHNPITGVVFNLFRRLGVSSVWMELLAAIAAVAVCLLLSFMAYQWVERPAIQWSRQLGRAGGKGARPGPRGAAVNRRRPIHHA
jgi:peptidoglycan/LPS O-acetylase OafA/YrhL